ncbi:MAG: hypothetical protein QNK24_04580 [Desulfuromusa sp.]|nr:hypothetical protein [Desulfuromusa sp.]
MAETMSRKQFFRKALFQTARASAELTQVLIPSIADGQKTIQYAFEADFPPELLAEEAKNMGLNPADKDAILAAIAEKLKPPET